MATKAWSNFCTRSFLKHWKTASENGVLPAYILPLKMATKACSNFFTRSFLKHWKTASGNGVLPARLAAQNGHEGVLQFLHQVVPETLKTVDGNGKPCQHTWAALQWPRRRAAISAPGRSWDLEKCRWKWKSSQHIGPLNMATKACSNFSTRSFLRPWKTADGSGWLARAFCRSGMATKAWSEFLHQVVSETLAASP